MRRKWLDGALWCGLLALFALVGCSDGPLSDPPLATVPNSIDDPRFRTTRATAAGPPVLGPPPATYTTRTGLVLAVTCANGDTVNCSDFGCQSDAQAYFDFVRAATGQDCHMLDGNDNDLLACESLPVACP